MNLTRRRLLSKHAVVGTWYRAVPPQHYQTALDFAHSATIAGRFHFGSEARPGFPILYLAETPLVALYEVNAMVGSPFPGRVSLPNPKHPWIILNVEVRLGRVADLTQKSQRTLLETTVQELTGDWQGYEFREPDAKVGPPYWSRVPTQRLGAALYKLRGLEGFLSYSAPVSTQRNLIVFPDKLRVGSYLRFTDPAAHRTLSIP